METAILFTLVGVVLCMAIYGIKNYLGSRRFRVKLLIEQYPENEVNKDLMIEILEQQIKSLEKRVNSQLRD